MKFLKFALAAVCLSAVSAPLLAQATGVEGLQFVDAVRSGDGDKAMQLMQSSGPRIVDARDSKGDTALIVAISNTDDRFTPFLLNKGADPNLTGHDGDTPLTAAARVGYTDAVEWLLGLGAKVDLANRRGETPLIIAVQRREPRIVKLLLDAGANPDKTDSVAGFSARDYATRDTRSREIQQMIQDKKPKAR
ncbi:MAG TPA: ankyrin repeat domain-containing protein [Sphingomicrobium sp.]|nr:ankyrin repeat domain-containing protein [Sphingomicrobium sp.]